MGYPIGHPLHGKYQPPKPQKQEYKPNRTVNMATTQENPATQARQPQTTQPNTPSDDHFSARIDILQNQLNQDQDERIVLGTLCDGLYLLATSPKHSICSTTTQNSQSLLWHSRMGHSSFLVLKQINAISPFIKSSTDHKWIDAMTKEINALESNGTWTLTTLPTNKIPIGCKWVYRIKYFIDGAAEKYKVSRAVIAVAIHNNWSLEQLDVNNSFLHSDLYEEVYMKENKKWFTKLTDFLTSLNFKQSYADTSLFTLNQDGHTTFLLVYVDDIILTRYSSPLLQHIKQQLHNKFSIRDLGAVHYYLGIEFLKNKSGMVISQIKYALELLQHVGVLEAKPTIIPLALAKQLNDIDGDPLPDPSMYGTLVGKLIYLTITKLGLSFAAQLLSHFSKQPRTTHMKALLKVVRYIKLCPRQGLYFPANNSLHLKAFCDSDWASCLIIRRSVTGYAIFLGPFLISWLSKKLPVVSRSST
ncbi:RmlC-like cupins superfamily protein [Tanacetum coccineum]